MLSIIKTTLRRIAAMPDAPAALSGLAQLRAMLRGEAPAASIGATLDFALAAIEEGRAVFKGRPGPGHLNPMGGVHGGWIATLLDSAMGCAAHSTLAPGEAYASTDLKVNFLRGLTPETGEVTAEGLVINRGRRMALVEERLTDGRGRLLAHGTSACMILPAA
jgi:uncharacterized protein (TIGR00369 family)